mgnify:CR=1 FL=1
MCDKLADLMYEFFFPFLRCVRSHFYFMDLYIMINHIFGSFNYSHYEFHRWMKPLLFKKLSITALCLVAGVEWGAEMQQLSAEGCHVHGYEPNPISFSSLQERIKDKNIQIHNKGLGGVQDKGKTLKIEYQGAKFNSDMLAVSDEIKARSINGQIGLLSVDTNNNEHVIISDALPYMNNIEQLWVEIYACNPHNRNMLYGLSLTHKLYDFVWWGKTSNGTDYFENIQEKYIDEYIERACKLVSPGAFLQTDIVAVRKDIKADMKKTIKTLRETIT